jgi:hypothetical protein
VSEVVPVRVHVRAPRIFAFQCLSTFDRTSPIWLPGYEPEVLRRDGDDLLVRLRHRTLGRVVAGVTRVRLHAPDRIVQELLDGSVCALRESLVLESEGEAATAISWSADVDLHVPLARLLERTVAARQLRAEATSTLDRFRVTIEAAALATGIVETPR